MINPCTAQPDTGIIMLTINASLLLSEEPPASTISLYRKYSISPLNYSNVPLIIHVDTIIQTGEVKHFCRKFNGDNWVVTKELIYKHSLWNGIDLHADQVCIAEIRTFIFLCSILVPHTDFNKSQPTFPAVESNRVSRFGRIILEIRGYILYLILRSIVFVVTRGVTRRVWQNDRNTHLPISEVGSERVNQIMKVRTYK